MVRISDFVFDTSHPPRTVSRPLAKRIAKLNIPGKNASILQDMGSDNMHISLSGSLYNTSSDTDKRRTDMDSLMTLAMANNPMTFTHDKDHMCGEDGDNWSEYANTTAMDVDWTATSLTRAVENSTVKVGSYSIKLTNLANGTFELDNISSLNMNLPEYSAICFWLYSSLITAANDITVYCITSSGNYYRRIIDAGTDFKLDTWCEIVLPVGSGASTDTTAVNGWETQGSPDWTNINYILLSWGASANATVYIDGFCLTHAVLFDSIPRFNNPMGKPDEYNYNINLVQYLQ